MLRVLDGICCMCWMAYVVHVRWHMLCVLDGICCECWMAYVACVGWHMLRVLDGICLLCWVVDKIQFESLCSSHPMGQKMDPLTILYLSYIHPRNIGSLYVPSLYKWCSRTSIMHIHKTYEGTNIISCRFDETIILMFYC